MVAIDNGTADYFEGVEEWSIQSRPAAMRVKARREANPARAARRQANLNRMAAGRPEYIPQYIDTHDRNGTVIASRYIGHKAVYHQREVSLS